MAWEDSEKLLESYIMIELLIKGLYQNGISGIHILFVILISKLDIRPKKPAMYTSFSYIGFFEVCTFKRLHNWSYI